MNGMDWTMTGDKLVVTIDCSKKAIDEAPPSRTGKTFLVATTGSSVQVPSKHCKELKIQVNVMAKKA